MKNILMLSWANIRKSKSQAVSLFIFVVLASMLLNIGLIIFLRVGSYFDERAEQNHMAHFTGIYDKGVESIQHGIQFMQSYKSMEEIEKTDAIGGYGYFFMNDTGNSTFIILSRADEAQKMDAPSLIGESLPLEDNAIYIPYFMFINGYEIGDDFKLILMGNELNFIIAGATEEIMFGSQMNTVHRFYIPDDRFYDLEEEFPDNGLTLLSARLETAGNDVFFQADYRKSVPANGLVFDLIYDSIRRGRTMLPLVAGIIVTVFAAILLFVSLIVIRFRIINSIEESITNIGAQKAVGFRSVQIILSIVIQFGGVALIGGAIGVAFSQPIIPLITGIFEPIIALVWNAGFDMITAIISLSTVLLTVVFIAFLSAKRISKLHPLIALRGGVTIHNYKKNPIPLERTSAGISLGFLLALKLILQNKKQAVTVIIIVAAVTMASVSMIAVSYSMNDGRNNFARTLAGEIPDFNFTLKNSGDGETFMESMGEHPDVRKVFGYTPNGVQLLINETSIAVNVAEDTALLEGQMLMEGRYPRHNNEIALGTGISRITGKTVADIVTARIGENEEEYLVTGIVQHISLNGLIGIISADGLRRLQPDYEFVDYNVYIHEGVDAEVFLEDIQAEFGHLFNSVYNVQSEISSMLGSMGNIFNTVTVGIVVVTVFVVVLVLYMVIKTSILKRRRELGIQKAVGFTTLQLMSQIALNMTPIILIGVVLGVVAGYFGFNPFVAATMSSMGIVKVNLPIPVNQVIVVCAALVILAFSVSMLIAWRIRKISAYALVSE